MNFFFAGSSIAEGNFAACLFARVLKELVSCLFLMFTNSLFTACLKTPAYHI